MVKENSDFVPQRRDIIWINLNPQSGHEQAGRRPAVVVSPRSYNQKARLCVVCPITQSVKGYPFEVKLQPEQKIQGVVLTDHLKSCDWASRRAIIADVMDIASFEEVIEKIKLLIE